MKKTYWPPEAELLRFVAEEKLADDPSDFLDDGDEGFDTVIDLDDLLGRN